MNSPICDMLGIEFPLLAFSHCRDVVTEVSRAGGFGVFGAVMLPPDRLEEELTWIDEHVGGKPYGVDLIVPNKFAGKGETITREQMVAAVPEEHKKFAADLLTSHDIDASDLESVRLEHGTFGDNLQES
ncbi:MAG: nitronate monooxygenase, partial [Candidatus Binatia bacterium]